MYHITHCKHTQENFELDKCNLMCMKVLSKQFYFYSLKILPNSWQKAPSKKDLRGTLKLKQESWEEDMKRWKSYFLRLTYITIIILVNVSHSTKLIVNSQLLPTEQSSTRVWGSVNSRHVCIIHINNMYVTITMMMLKCT